MNKKLLIEFIGTFFLVLTVALTGNPLAIGGVLATLVYMGGYISGANYNPAVTLALFINEKIDFKTMWRYIAVQMSAGVIAAAVYYGVQGSRFVPQIAATATLPSAFLVEVIYTFLLCTVVLNVATTDKVKDNQYYGAAIGLALMVGAFAGGPISGGAFNPAVGVSPLLYDYQNLGTQLVNMSVYLAGPLTGGILAGLIYQNTNKKKYFFN